MTDTPLTAASGTISVAATRQRPATDTPSWRLAMQRNTTPDERFWAKVEKTDTCWLWKGSKPLGYGQFIVHGKAWRAHRYAYETLVGPVPEGLVLDHLCRVPACVNPSHLEPVTNRVNVMRGVGISAVNAAKTHCKHGHELTAENLRVLIHSDGGERRECRACRREISSRGEYRWAQGRRNAAKKVSNE